MKRYVVLLLFCLGNGLNEMMQLTFSPVFAATQAAFGASVVDVTALPTLYLIAFAPAAFALALLRTRLGLRACLLGGVLVQALGAWARFAACAAPAVRGSFYLLAAGQLLAALAQPVFINLPAVLSSTWFAAADRALSTVFATIANPVGNALGSVVPGLLVPDGASPSVAAAALAHITLAQAVVATLVAAAVFAFVDDAPVDAPSAAAAIRRVAARTKSTVSGGDVDVDDGLDVGPQSGVGAGAGVALLGPSTSKLSSPVSLATAWSELSRDAISLFRNRNFLFLLLGFSIGLGIFNALLAILGQLLTPCGYTPSVAGIAGGAMLLSGLLTAIFAGFALRATGAFVPALRFGIASAAVGMLGFLLALRPHGEVVLLVASAILGAAAVPLLPLSLENAAEATFPIVEDMSAALLTAAGKLFGVAFVFILQPLATSSSCSTVATPVFFFVTSAIVIAATSLFFFQIDYRRVSAEATAAREEGAPRPNVKQHA